MMELQALLAKTRSLKKAICLGGRVIPAAPSSTYTTDQGIQHTMKHIVDRKSMRTVLPRIRFRVRGRTWASHLPIRPFDKSIIPFVSFVLMTIWSLNMTEPPGYSCLLALVKSWEVLVIEKLMKTFSFLCSTYLPDTPEILLMIEDGPIGLVCDALPVTE